MPNIIVLPQATYHLAKEYKTVDKKEITEIVEEGNEKESVEYSLSDCSVDKDIDVFDGGDIATPDVFNKLVRL